MFGCMCASEECQVNGCARLRDLMKKQSRVFEMWPLPSEPTPLPPKPARPPTPPAPNVARGWVCPLCGGVNGPAALVCYHCPTKPLKVTCGGDK